MAIPTRRPRAPCEDAGAMQSIGRGATSEVFATADGRALKRLHAHLLGDAATVSRFLAEARLTRGLVHPNVVRIDEVGRDDAGCFLVMERVVGETLAARLERESLEEAEVRSLGCAVAEGMAAVHARGIVHRDLKPANIMLAGAVPKILDFGIAKSLGHGSAARGQTTTRIGTPAYMAPEQLAAGVIAPAIDVWALGVILFEAAEGMLPFSGFEHGRAPQLLGLAPRAMRVSPALARVIAACLSQEPARRPVMSELASLLRDDAPERVTQTVHEPRRRRWWIPASALAALIAIACLLWPHTDGRVALPALPTYLAPIPHAIASPAPAKPAPPLARPKPQRPTPPKKARAAGETLD